MTNKQDKYREAFECAIAQLEYIESGLAIGNKHDEAGGIADSIKRANAAYSQLSEENERLRGALGYTLTLCGAALWAGDLDTAVNVLSEIERSIRQALEADKEGERYDGR